MGLEIHRTVADGKSLIFNRKNKPEYYQFSAWASKAEFLVLTHLSQRDTYCDTEKYLKVQEETIVGPFYLK